MVAVVEIPVEIRRAARGSLRLRLLGPVAVERDGAAVPLPASRKVRALLAYLALSPVALSRARLCELLWDAPSDPRGELRWCLSKLRRLLDGPDRARVVATAETVRLDLEGCEVDALEVARGGLQPTAPAELRALCGLFHGEFLEGLEIGRSPAFTGWLVGQRRRFRALRGALLERLADASPGDEGLAPLEEWLQVAPLDAYVHQRLLAELARRGRFREGDEHLAAAARLFAGEGLDIGPVRDAWHAARAPAWRRAACNEGLAHVPRRAA